MLIENAWHVMQVKMQITIETLWFIEVLPHAFKRRKFELSRPATL